MSQPADLPPCSEPTTVEASRFRPGRRGLLAAAATMVLVLGAGLLLAGHGRSSIQTAIAPTAIDKLQTSDAVAAQGRVTEVFGNKFILQDASGRALVDTGPEGEGLRLVTTGEAVKVQGRFENDELHAAMITGPDGRSTMLAPLAPPPGVLERAKERIGLWPQPDVGALTGLVRSAGYSDVRITGRGPRHLEIVAKDADGKDRDLHVDFDGRIREQESF